ncbi:MAG: hypothetical protein SX243_11865 [Acidobacteriota bacterium]|nr:hypothetical protein [Acidobacteriota bacterium]
MGKDRRDAKPVQPVVTDGIVEIDFDAGGPGLSVGPNPVRATWSDQARTTVQVLWRLRKVRNSIEGWTVLLGNVVPCDCEQLPQGFLDSSPRGSGHVWIWRFPWSPDREEAVAIPYELFVVYRPEGSTSSLEAPPVQPIALPPRLLGLREVTGLDPTVLLPPRQGPG